MKMKASTVVGRGDESPLYDLTSRLLPGGRATVCARIKNGMKKTNIKKYPTPKTEFESQPDVHEPSHGLPTNHAMAYRRTIPWPTDEPSHGPPTNHPMAYRRTIPWPTDEPSHGLPTNHPMAYRRTIPWPTDMCIYIAKIRMTFRRIWGSKGVKERHH